MKYNSLKQIQENLTTADLNGMTKKELMSIFYKVVPAAQMRVNRELRRIENDNSLMSISLGERMKNTNDNPNFSLSPNANIGKLKKQVKDALEYLDNKTSTESGWDKVKSESAKNFGVSQRTFNKLAKDKSFWNTLKKIQEEYPNFDSDTIVKIYGENVQKKSYKNMTESEQIDYLRKQMDKAYEEAMKKEQEDEEYVEKFFE